MVANVGFKFSGWGSSTSVCQIEDVDLRHFLFRTFREDTRRSNVLHDLLIKFAWLIDELILKYTKLLKYILKYRFY